MDNNNKNGMLDKIRQTVEGGRSQIGDVQRKMREEDRFDEAKASYKIDRQIENRIADRQAEQTAKFLRGETTQREAVNTFEEDEATKLYVSTLKEVIGDFHNMTRSEMKNQIKRMEALQAEISNSDLLEGDFINTQYEKSMSFMQREYEKKSEIVGRAANKIGELSEQYLDIQSLFSGFVDHNPIMMGLFKVGADAVRSYRTNKAQQKKLLTEDARRRNFADTLEADKAKDEKKHQARREKIDEAEKHNAEQVSEKSKVGPREDTPLPNATENVVGPREDTPLPFERVDDAGGDAMSMFGDEFAFPEDEFSNTGDAAEGISQEQMEALSQATGGVISSFTRIADDDDDYAQAREELRKSRELGDVVSTPVDNMETLEGQLSAPEISTQTELENKLAESFTKSSNAEEERESDEYMAETVQWQEKVIEKFDKLIDAVDNQEKMFTKLNKSVANSGDSLADDVLDVAGIVGGSTLAGGIIAKMSGLIKKVPGGKAVLKAGSAIAGATGLSKILPKGAAAAETVAKTASDDVAKAGGKVAGQRAGKTVGKSIGKSLLKKIPLLGLIAGAGFAVGRLMEGDVEGAGLELASGAVSLLPGIGTAASVAIDAGLLARDLSEVDNSNSNTEQPIAYNVAGNALYSGDNLNQPVLLDRNGRAWTYNSTGQPVTSGKIGSITQVDFASNKSTRNPASNKPTRNPVEMQQRNYMDRVVSGRGSEQAFGIGSGTDRLLMEIAEGEGTSDSLARLKGFGSGYDVPYGHGQFGRPDKALSSMTIKEIKEFQKKQIMSTRGTIPGTSQGTGAVGKYQVTQTTLEELQNQLGFDDDAIFDKNLQDRMGKALLDRRGYSKFIRGEMSDKDFQTSLSKEWASIANPDTNMSYYGQATGTTTDEIQSALRQSKLEHSMERQTVLQTAQLEKGVGEYVLRSNQNNIPDVQTVAPPAKPQMIAKQSGNESLRGNEISNVSARNSDSTLQRVTDRWISHGFA